MYAKFDNRETDLTVTDLLLDLFLWDLFTLLYV